MEWSAGLAAGRLPAARRKAKPTRITTAVMRDVGFGRLSFSGLIVSCFMVSAFG